MKYFLTVLWVCSAMGSSAFAYIPPVNAIVEQIVKERKENDALQVQIQHQVTTLSGASVQIDEKILSGKGRTYILWRLRGSAQVNLKAEAVPKAYILDAKQRVTRRSELFLDTFVEDKAESFRNDLLEEQFVRRDQLLQYQPGFTPKGDPKSWKLSQNGMKHEDIFLQRLRGGVAIAVVGMDQGLDKRVAFFRQDLTSLARLEWREAGQTVAWNFFSTSRRKGLGYFPERMSFEIRNREVVKSTLVSVKRLSAKEWDQDYSAWVNEPSGKSIPDELDSALKLLLSYR